jgi:GT2 family glycosyltransferase
VVVTRNRREALCRCLDAVDSQEVAPDRILVVDNASTDGTQALVRERYPHVDLVALAVNEGGAGGFHEGVKRAHAGGAEWLWLQDDDTVSERDALGELLAAATRLQDAGGAHLLASRVLWRDGSVHPLNFPVLERRRMDRVVAAAALGTFPVRSATFVSLLVHRAVVDRFGLPLKHFFLWGDDVEYTSRAVLGGEGAYFVPSSVVLHDTASPLNFTEAEPARFYYHVRNTLLIARNRERPVRDRFIRIWTLVSTAVGYLARFPHSSSMRAVARGVRDGLRTRP